MKLKEIINGQQLVNLLHESDSVVSLGLHDQDCVYRIDIRADMAVLPDEAVLSIEVNEVHDRVDLADWWRRGDVLTDGDMPQVWTRAEPSPTWMITPVGREFDLRAHEGGLF